MATQIPEGYELLSGRGQSNARAALALAQDRGFEESVVLTIQEGYLIPLGDEADEFPDPEKNTKAEIEEYRDKHFAGLELSGTKAEMVAALKDAAENKGE